jgi:hypothetical protein
MRKQIFFSTYFNKILTLLYLLSGAISLLQSVNMSSPHDFVLNKETSSVVRGIILARGKHGCTLKQIKGKLVPFYKLLMIEEL